VRYDDYDHIGHTGGLGFVLLGLALLLLFGLGLGLVVWGLSRRSTTPVTGPVGPTTNVSPARSILDERFARGEIDEDEYRRRRILLDGAPGT
jgi:putative membrane protein